MTKASSLEKAKESGLLVPDFFVIPHDIADEDLAQYIAEHSTSIVGISNGLYSVRSSANVEDATDLSYAGQFETYLNVSQEDLYKKVRACRESATRTSVSKYANTTEIIQMDVIIQVMVSADISGVVFTANPNGMLNETVITIGRGAGTVVADQVPTTTYYYHHDDEVFYAERSDNSPVLDTDMVRRIVDMAARVMEIFGRYSDVEIAIKDDRLWLLQVRPITSIDASKLVVFDSHNLVESYPGISLPLTQTFVTEAYTGIFRRLLERSIGQKAVSRYDGVLAAMVRPLNGRMYYEVSNWYDILQLLPLRKKILPIWQEMVGVDLATIETNVWPRRIDRFRILLGFLSGAYTIPRKMERLHEDFLQIEADFRARPLDGLSVAEVLKRYDTLTHDVLKDWDVTLANDMYAFVGTGLYKRFTKSSTPLESSIELPSSRLLYDFDELAIYCKQQTDFGRVVQMNHRDFMQFYESDEPLATRLREYVDIYGDRVPEELKLETETFRSNPLLLIKRISSYVPLGKLDHAKAKQPNGLVARYLYKRASLGVYNREQSRIDRARIYGMVRTCMLEMGKALAAQGRIEVQRDIFYLTLDELRNAKSSGSFVPTITARKTASATLKKYPAYSKLIYARGAVVEKQPYSGDDAIWSESGNESLQGIACSPGVVEGEAVLVSDATSADVAGKIIIALTTDPGWVFLLTQSIGIVAEKGSLLSHTAIVSRELHIPSVVGVKNATTVIRNGDRIRLDGATGLVEILK